MEGFEDLLSEDLIPVNETTNLGNSFLTFDGLLPDPGLLLHEDGGASGCGGKLWPAGELLSRYLMRNGLDSDVRTVIELGSGTGLAGLAIAAREKSNGRSDLSVWITDQENMVELMSKNTKLNELEDIVKVDVLNWGMDDLPDYARQCDLILAADCVYLETAFPLLEKTLLDLTEERPVPILMAYKKRRKADSRFFKKIKKNFKVTEINDYLEYETFHKDSVYLFKMQRQKAYS